MADIQLGYPGYYQNQWYTVSDKNATEYLLTYPGEVDQWVPKAEVTQLYRQRSLVWYNGHGDESGLPYAFYKYIPKEPLLSGPHATIYSSTPPRTYYDRPLRELTTFRL